MAKKSGFFSWFNKGGKESQQSVEKDTSQNAELSPELSQKDNEPAAVDASSQIEETQPLDEPKNSGQSASELDVENKDEEKSPLETKAPEQNNEPDALGSSADEDITAANDVVTEQAEVHKPESEPVSGLDSSDVVQEIRDEKNAAINRVEASTAETQSAETTKPKVGFFERLKKGLSKTRQQIGGGFLSLFKGKEIDEELYEELETQLLMADVGMDTTVKLIERLTDHADRKQLKDADALYGLLKNEMSDILKKSDAPLVVNNENGPFVILMVGVNGVGKTTTIGKMAKQFQQQGKSVMLAAGDTFRAAAVEQLQVWGERNDVPVIAQHTGADSASVIFDAYQAAKARNADVLIADTAGRLQNKDNLMQELEKIVRVLKKFDAAIPHEIMLTIDATTGQNAISQTKIFNEAVGLTGLSLTKLDGTAKGGVIFAVAEQFEIPIRYIGVGEGIEDLRTFEHQSFIDALFDEGV